MPKKQEIADILQETNLVGFGMMSREKTSETNGAQKPTRSVTAKRDEDPVKDDQDSN